MSSSMLRAAIDQLKKYPELEQLKQSADLYAEIYSKENDLKDLTETVIKWMARMTLLKRGMVHRC